MGANILGKAYYLRQDVVYIARDLLGKFLVTNFEGRLTSGMISETEAYAGTTDKASHAYGNRLTARTEVMYRNGGIAYVYLCYGIHSLFNIVTNKSGIPHAILIRGIIPKEGSQIMLQRSGKTRIDKNIGSGPGRVSKILGIHYSHTGLPLTVEGCHTNTNKPAIRIEDRGVDISPSQVRVTSRVGVGYAEEDAMLPYRFLLIG
nr:DNA-3-methyladenine glycosylase [Bacteroidota bacterium]